MICKKNWFGDKFARDVLQGTLLLLRKKYFAILSTCSILRKMATCNRCISCTILKPKVDHYQLSLPISFSTSVQHDFHGKFHVRNYDQCPFSVLGRLVPLLENMVALASALTILAISFER